MTSADAGKNGLEYLGQKKAYFGTYTAESGDTTVSITAPSNRKVFLFLCEGMTKYSVSGNTYTVTITNPAATVTRNYIFIYI